MTHLHIFMTLRSFVRNELIIIWVLLGKKDYCIDIYMILMYILLSCKSYYDSAYLVLAIVSLHLSCACLNIDWILSLTLYNEHN